MTVWVVTFHDDDGRGGTNSCAVAVFATEDLAADYIGARPWPRSWYSIDEFCVNNEEPK